MSEADKTRDDATRRDSTEDAVGDVETAGETTAADTVSGPENTKPVGEGTSVEVADEPSRPRSAE